MSAALLRESVNRRIQHRTDEWVAELVGNRGMSLDDMRSAQGVLHGLALAAECVKDAYEEIHN